VNVGPLTPEITWLTFTHPWWTVGVLGMLTPHLGDGWGKERPEGGRERRGKGERGRRPTARCPLVRANISIFVAAGRVLVITPLDELLLL